MIKKFNFFCSFFLLIFLATSAYSINPDKVERKLNNIYRSGNFYKLEKKALSYNKKQSTLEAPYYYLSLLEVEQAERIPDKPNKRQWTHLQKASRYASKLKDDRYSYWQDSIASIINTYMLSLASTQFDNRENVKDEYDKYICKTQDSGSKVNSTKRKEKEVNYGSLSSIRKEMISFAEKQIGIPYLYGGESPDKGFDCSGFVKYVYSTVGISLPHNAHMQSQLDGKEVSLADAKPGDIIFFGSRHSKGWRTQHSGLVYGHKDDNILFIHASSSRGIVIDGNNSSWDSYWESRVLFVKRLPELK